VTGRYGDVQFDKYGVEMNRTLYTKTKRLLLPSQLLPTLSGACPSAIQLHLGQLA
jgi:hypothetical protein